MKKVAVLDCTLRDGGYCNQWEFGFHNITKIIQGLVEANVDIIECGFLAEKIKYGADISIFNTPKEIKELIPSGYRDKLFVAMINYGEYDIDHLEECDKTSIDGIRLAFHKKDVHKALECAKKIKEKGYQLFVQPMVSLTYTDEEFLWLIKECNIICPYAFYIVDSFGVMKTKDLIRLYYMVEHNLNSDIKIGFHAHNNMQLAYSNAQTLINCKNGHDLIVDSSIYGMGRGAGNLNTELFVAYLNDSLAAKYKLEPLLSIIDEILERFYKEKRWGYSLPNYLSASYNTHPNYAEYLSSKNTLTFEAMSEIFKMMDETKRTYYDKEYIEKLYLGYLSSGSIQEERKEELLRKLENKKVLLIAPGKSSYEEKKRVEVFADCEDVVTISINFNYEYVNADYVFISNQRRYRELEVDQRKKCIVTSNISAQGIFLRVNYQDLLNEQELIQDNAGMMAIKFFSCLGVKEIYLAGFDGYAYDMTKNYEEGKMTFVAQRLMIDKINIGMNKIIKEYEEFTKIFFLTQPKHIIL